MNTFRDRFRNSSTFFTFSTPQVFAVWLEWVSMSGNSMTNRNTHKTSGVTTIAAKVLVSNRRCMKYMATRMALATAITTRSVAFAPWEIGEMAARTSRIVSARSHQKMAM